MIGMILMIGIVVVMVSIFIFSFEKPVFKIEKETDQVCTRYHVYQLTKIYNIITLWERKSTEFSLKDAQTKVKELQSYKTELIETIGQEKT